MAARLWAATSGQIVEGPTPPLAATNEAATVEQEFRKLMEADDDAQGEVDKWIQDNQQFTAKGAGIPAEQLNRRIRERFEPIRKGYEDFLRRHPDHARARVAYASFLGDLQDEDGARLQLEKALTLETNNPAIYNNLAEICAHSGPVKKAFEYYDKAIQLKPDESLYPHNLGNVVYLFRNDAKEYYSLNDEQLVQKVFCLYSNAMRLDPENFLLASDIAQTYYGLTPLRVNDALRAWTNALHLARDDIEREGVYLHFARLNIIAGRLAEARARLNAVTNQMYAELKQRLTRNLDLKANPPKATNAPVPPAPPK